jgi:hypothetical protein
MKSFSTYEAYCERYRMFYNEEGDDRPPMLSAEQFSKQFQLLKESYRAYRDLIQMGQTEQAALYYAQVINSLEDQLAIADASDNLNQEIYPALEGDK